MNDNISRGEKNLSVARGWQKMAKEQVTDTPAQDGFVHEVAFDFQSNASSELTRLVLEHSPYPFQREDRYSVVVPGKTDADAYIAFLKTNPAVDPDSIDYTQHT